MTEMMTGGAAIVAGLLANGVDTVFGLPGAQMYPLFDALQTKSDHIQTYITRHEQAAAYMAFGYARSTGKAGVYSVVPGPGMLNTTAALVTALGCCAPVLCLTGQVPKEFLGAGRGHLHEIPDQLATLRSVTKWAERIERPADAPAAVAEAFRQMLSGRPGPVALEMAWDVMASAEPCGPGIAAKLDTAPVASTDAVAKAAALIRAAKRPMIFTGSGAQHASVEIEALARMIGATVTGFRGGRGIADETGPHGLMSHAAALYYREADVVIAIGTRAELPTMRWTGMMKLHRNLPGGRKLIRIDIDPTEATRLEADVNLTTDAALGANALMAALKGHQAPDHSTTVEQVRHDSAKAWSGVQPQVSWLNAIRKALPSDGYLVEELCQAGFASYFAYPVRQPRTYVSTGYQGTLGFGFMTALGVKAAHPEKAVVSMTGDGGFQFGLQELATAKQHGLALVTVLFDNGGFGNVRRDQQTRFDGRLIGADLDNPDFAALAKAYGIASETVETPEQLETALGKALNLKAPSLVIVRSPRGSEGNPWPFIHVAM